jgi:hypothetical protein
LSFAAVAALLILFILPVPTNAQQRMSDHDIENVMKNLKSDSKRFQSSFDSAISKSTIRKTDQEKIDKGIVKTFQAQVETMLSVFQSKKRADATLPPVLTSAKQIDDVFIDVQLSGEVKADWNKCRQELGILADQFNMRLQ